MEQAVVLRGIVPCPPVLNNGYLPDYVIQAGVRAGVTPLYFLFFIQLRKKTIGMFINKGKTRIVLL